MAIDRLHNISGSLLNTQIIGIRERSKKFDYDRITHVLFGRAQESQKFIAFFFACKTLTIMQTTTPLVKREILSH